MKVLYFTATGNSLYIAKSIGGELCSIPKMIKEGTYTFTDDKIGIVFPIYGVGVPEYIIDFIKKATFKCEYLFAIMTYGMYAGGSANQLTSIAEQTGKKFNYINTIQMVDNWLLLFEMKKQQKSAPKKQIEKHLQSIKSDINESKQSIVKNSMMEKFVTNYFIKVAQNAHNSEKKPNNKKAKHIIGQAVNNLFTVEDTCIKCKICIQVCPVNNIKMINNKITFGDQCISCLACTQNCPQNAIRILGEKSKARFRNSNITLKEIITANN